MPDDLREKVAHYRYLAFRITDERVKAELERLAEQYEQQLSSEYDQEEGLSSK